MLTLASRLQKHFFCTKLSCQHNDKVFLVVAKALLRGWWGVLLYVIARNDPKSKIFR